MKSAVVRAEVLVPNGCVEQRFRRQRGRLPVVSSGYHQINNATLTY
jgi:hypothetical protein